MYFTMGQTLKHLLCVLSMVMFGFVSKPLEALKERQQSNLTAILLIICYCFPILSSLVITKRDPLMGMEIEVKVAGMNWSKISGSMAKFEPKGTIRMADGQLTFPDEEPAADWKELRIALPAGMVTIRKTPTGVTLVTWGNVSQELIEQRDLFAKMLEE